MAHIHLFYKIVAPLHPTLSPKRGEGGVKGEFIPAAELRDFLEGAG